MLMGRRLFLLHVLACTVTSLLVLPIAGHAQQSLPPGTRLATEEDLPLMRAAGIPNPTVGMLWDPSNAYAGESVGQVKTYLMSLPRTGSATMNSNIESLNSAFATCSSNFLKEFQKYYGPVVITSAYRSAEDERRLCVNNTLCGSNMNNPNPNSLHTRGFAMDVKAPVQNNLVNFARSNPQFGVCFPFTGEGGGFKDDVHMILAGISSAETRGPGCVGVVKACNAGLFSPSMLTVSGASGQSGALPLQQPVYQPPYPMVYQPQTSTMMPPSPPMPPFQPQLMGSAAPPMSATGFSNVSPSVGTSPTIPTFPTQGTTPIYASSSTRTPAAALIIAQSTTVARNSSTLIAWTSVGMVPASCSISADGASFGTGPQGSRVLSIPATAPAGTVALLFDCTDWSGVNHKRTLSITIR